MPTIDQDEFAPQTKPRIAYAVCGPEGREFGGYDAGPFPRKADAIEAAKDLSSENREYMIDEISSDSDGRTAKRYRVARNGIDLEIVEADGTSIEYLYRDEDNNKVWETAILDGAATDAQIAEIMRLCSTNVPDPKNPSFVPGQIGLRDLQSDFKIGGGWNPNVDHPFHEIVSIDRIYLTAATRKKAMRLADFVQRIGAVKWDISHVPEFAATRPAPRMG